MASKKSNADKPSAAEASVTSLDTRRRPPSRKGIPATPAQRKALAKGTANNKERGKKKREPGEKSRWQSLLDGDITIDDLTTEELQKMQCHDRHGNFTGRPPLVPARIARDMKAELLKRGQSMIDSAYVDAVALLHGVVSDTRQKTADRIKAAQLIVERSAGRMPETVRVEKAATWDETFEDGVVIVTDGERAG